MLWLLLIYAFLTDFAQVLYQTLGTSACTLGARSNERRIFLFKVALRELVQRHGRITGLEEMRLIQVQTRHVKAIFSSCFLYVQDVSGVEFQWSIDCQCSLLRAAPGAKTLHEGNLSYVKW
jgi:hypothetical protein